MRRVHLQTASTERCVLMANLLTPNVLRAIYNSESQPVAGIPTPVLQVLAVKKINSTSPNSTERWRVVLSDGSHFIQSMLATQLNPMIANNEIIKGGLLRLVSYTMNKMKDKKCTHCRCDSSIDC